MPPIMGIILTTMAGRIVEESARNDKNTLRRNLRHSPFRHQQTFKPLVCDRWSESTNRRLKFGRGIHITGKIEREVGAVLVEIW